MTDNNRTIETLTAGYFAQLKALARQIKLGMNRLDVEALFRQSYGGVQGQGITIYHQARGAKVEVPFNNFGGPCSSQNQVSGEARVYIELQQNRWGIEQQK